MQMAMAAIAAISSAGPAAATAATAASAVGTAATAASSAMTILQGIGTVTSILGTIGAGFASANASEAQAIQTDLQAGQEKVEATRRQTQMSQELAKVLGENEVTFASAGIDVSAGIAQSAAASAKKRAATEISIDRRDQEFRSALLRQRASGLRSKARGEKRGALIGALGQGIDFGISRFERG